MAKELTRQQLLEINLSLTVDANGNTNKKCPLCNNVVIVSKDGTAITIRCKSDDCFEYIGRGI